MRAIAHNNAEIEYWQEYCVFVLVFIVAVMMLCSAISGLAVEIPFSLHQTSRPGCSKAFLKRLAPFVLSIVDEKISAGCPAGNVHLTSPRSDG